MRSLSQALAWRVGRYLTACPEPAPGAGRAAEVSAWRLLAWTLKAAEDNGVPADAVVQSARSAHSIAAVLSVARHSARHQPDGADGNPAAALPPWLAVPDTPPPSGDERDLAAYISAAQALIGQRVEQLITTAETSRPAWITALGAGSVTASRRDQWRRHVGVIAAYRDQHRILDADPRQVLGPYPEPGRAGHAAYWHAVESVLAARRLAGLDPCGQDRYHHDAAARQVAVDIYSALDDAERSALHMAAAGRLGPSWCGDHDPQPADPRHEPAALRC